MPDLQKSIRLILWAGFASYSFLSLLYIPYRAHSNYLVILLLATVLIASSAFLILWLRQREFIHEIDIAAATRLLWFIIAVGIILRVIFVTVIPPIQLSDNLAYLRAASRLVEEGRYYFPNPNGELLAWRPPGYPFLLAVLMLIFGKTPWLPLAINLVCFTITCLAVRSLAERLIGNRTASLFAVSLIALWPNAIAGSGHAVSEWPSLALLTVGLWAIINAQDGLWRYSVLAGLCMGYGALVRPGLMFLPVCWFIYFAIARPFDQRRLTRNLAALIVAVAVIAPWSIRNYQVLHEFIPISTNGGSIFYRANNPLATGGFIRQGERDIKALISNEVLQNRTGFAWGMEWIRSDPLGFLSLAFKKQAIFTGRDDNSIYWALERAYNETGLRYFVIKLIANSWWVVIMLLMPVASINCRRQLCGDPAAGLLIASILYVLAVHSVFESQPRHHQPLYGLIAILASMAIWRPAVPTKAADRH